ncbi:hypothetical protein AADB47_001862 [Salmonella enterica]|uniref:Uncharacterized protein n=1 Tax=Salmonella diarizonae TaxID=59204 RepID=A0A379U5C0_SALDZ|nr:hypothetical protein [Salmonella enterica]EKO0997877.1 hypothetical protein [Salmonella enterica subsp. enterica]EAW7983706.1 hypothetical protein [Salmonella enterica]EAY4774527.1 hypothetical protein [Salmonella enterica]ECH9337831.1 hypothetical protein [Salmonella enterica subsp. diarizonae]EDL8429454.1 hypothetical protein [Salmonella enterica subsp. diarizonae]
MILNLQMISKLELFFSFCGIHRINITSQNTFSVGSFIAQVNAVGIGAKIELVLILKINAPRPDIALRMCQSMRPESIFGVVGSFFFVNNRLSLSCLLPEELGAEDWYRIFEYQKDYMLSFLSEQ